MRAEYVIGEAATNLRRNVLLVLGAILAVFVSLFMTYMALVVNEVARNSAERWQEGISIIAWLDDADLADHTIVTNEVADWVEVKRAVYVGKAEAWQEFRSAQGSTLSYRLGEDRVEPHEGSTPETMQHAIQMGSVVTEGEDGDVINIAIPIRVRGEREFGESRVAGNLWRYGARIAQIIFRSYRDYHPLRFFGGIALALLVPAAGLGGFLLWHYLDTGHFSPHKWAGFSALGLAGLAVLMLHMGVIGDMLTRHRVYLEELLSRQRSETRRRRD